jgi:acyl-coenzyme A thioesterase PaaI-like protein
MLDDAAFFAVQSVVTEAFVLTVSFQVYLLEPVVRGEMVSSGRIVHRSKRFFLAESVIEVDGRPVARGNGSFGRSAIRLDDSVGYR